jgi:glycosyltransferase 2 family protein
MKKRPYLFQLASAAISLSALVYAFWGIEWELFLQNLRMVRPLWYALAVALIIFSILIRAWRWKYLLQPVGDIPVKPLFASIMIGSFGNNVLPFRLGEILRAYSGAKLTGIRGSTLLSTIILERVIEIVTFFLTLLVVSYLIELPEALQETRLILFLALFALAIAFVILYFLNASLNRWLENMNNRFARTALSFLNGLHTLFELKRFDMVSLISFLLWGVYALHYFAGLKSMNLPVGFSGAFIVMMMSTFSVSIPSAPGFVGTYHLALVWALQWLGVEKSEALPFAVMIHLAGFISLSLWGFYYYLQSEIDWKTAKTMNSDSDFEKNVLNLPAKKEGVK